ncbi:hypothetical protein ZWY2020_036594 [Hordeum vulgare]|nr:hypothetical protein ZWY2020_036594 [Hordeum vulgare]
MATEEEHFRSMVDEGVDREDEEKLPLFRSEVTRTLQEMESPPYHQDQLHAFEKLDWSQSLEDSTVDVVEFLAADGDERRRGDALFAAEQPMADALRSQAAWYDARRDEDEEIAAGARQLRHRCLTTVATAKTEDIVCLGAVDYIEHVFKEMPHVASSPAEQMAVARAQAKAKGPAAKRFAKEFAEVAGRLRRGAADFGGEDQGLARALTERAATVDALCADMEAFVDKMENSAYWRMLKHLN